MVMFFFKYVCLLISFPSIVIVYNTEA